MSQVLLLAPILDSSSSILKIVTDLCKLNSEILESCARAASVRDRWKGREGQGKMAQSGALAETKRLWHRWRKGEKSKSKTNQTTPPNYSCKRRLVGTICGCSASSSLQRQGIFHHRGARQFMLPKLISTLGIHLMLPNIEQRSSVRVQSFDGLGGTFSVAKSWLNL